MNPLRMKRVLFLVAVIAALTSCQKEMSFDSSTGSPSGGGGTGGGGSTTDTYQPVTKGSFWKYKDSAFTGQITLMTSTGTQKTIGGKSYYVITSETTGQPAFEGYFYVNKPVYGTRQDLNNGVVTTIEFVHLVDTASVGATWTTNMPPVNGLNAQCIGTMMEKNISKTVAGKNFTNVIHTQLDLQYEVPILGWTSFAIYDYYIAKNIGIIRIETSQTFGGSLRTVADLIDYSIK